MSYSCSDFFDDIVTALGVYPPDKQTPDDQEETADLCLFEIMRLQKSEATLLEVEKGITPLDLAWEQINALGGAHDPSDIDSIIYAGAIGDALGIIERLGGSDPLPKRAVKKRDAGVCVGCGEAEGVCECSVADFENK
jgi:heterodisulfide reductase subunit A-like polyferredoxin